MLKGSLVERQLDPKGVLAMNTAMPYNDSDEYRFRDTKFSKKYADEVCSGASEIGS